MLYFRLFLCKARLLPRLALIILAFFLCLRAGLAVIRSLKVVVFLREFERNIQRPFQSLFLQLIDHHISQKFSHFSGLLLIEFLLFELRQQFPEIRLP